MKAQDMIASAMRLIGVLDPNETMEASAAQDGLMVLNGMIDSWNADRLMIFTVNRQVFNLTSGKAAYTLGIGGDFNIARPTNIERGSIISLSNPAQPLELPIEGPLTEAQWSAIPVKNTQGSLPRAFYDDNNFPFRNLSFWPVPTANVQVALYIWQVLNSFSKLTDDHTFPPGYFEAIRYNLAARLAPEFQNAILSPVVIELARSSMALVKSLNAPEVDLRCDPALVTRGGGFDWRTGESR